MRDFDHREHGRAKREAGTTTATSGRLGLAAAEAPLGLAERLRGRATGRRKRPGMGQKRGLGLLGPARP